jgi:hypothetical protein
MNSPGFATIEQAIKMTKKYNLCVAAIAVKSAFVSLLIASWAQYCQADPVTDWRTYRQAAVTTLAGQGTDDPVLGDLTNTSQASFMLGYLTTPAVLGGNDGDFVKLTFGVSFNDAVGGQGAGDNFRFALFDLNGEAQDSATGGSGGGPNYTPAGTTNTDNFRGYWFGNKGGGGAGDNGSIRERPAALTGSMNPFTNNATDPAPSLGSVGGVNIPLHADVSGNGAGGDYIGEMTLTREAGGIHLRGFLKNAANHNGDDVIDAADYVAWRKLDEENSQGYDLFVENFDEVTAGGVGNLFDVTDTTPTSAVYGAVGFLNGNGLNFDQVIFTNVDVSRGTAGSAAAAGVPEPTVVVLAVTAAMMLLGFARGWRRTYACVLVPRSNR